MATNTATTSVTHTGNGSTNAFAISFSFLADSEIDVTVAGVLKTITTHYTISGSTVTFTSGNTPANGAAIKFQRDTDISAKKVDFSDGSVLTEADLDTNSDQVIFAQQEITDKLSGIEEGATADQTISEIKSLIAGSPLDPTHIANNAINADKIGSGQVTETKIATNAITQTKIADNAVIVDKLPDGVINTAKIATDAVNGSKIADDSINSEHYVDGSIDTAHIADAQITAAKLQDGSVTSTKLGTDSVVEAKIVNSNVTAAKLASNSVQTAKIADDAVQTAKIADTAITEAKIGNAQITSAKLANNAVTNDKIADAELTTLAGMQSGTASKLADSTALTADIADLNQIDGMAKQTTITDDDTKFPTSGAVVDYVTGQLDDIGGFESITNELSFPNTQAPNGVSISIADAAGLVVNSSGVSTTARTLNGTTVTINNIPSNFHSSTIATGIRFIVTSTGSGQIYNYHKATLAESDLVSLSGDINDFAERYRVGSSNPTTSLDNGDLFFNTSTGKMLVYNGTNSAWEEVQSIGNFFISTLSPAFDGTTTDFTITNAPTNVQQILLIIEGVLQKPNSGTSTPSEGFALDGSTVKLAAAPAIGASYHAVVMGSTVNIGTPSNNTVTSAILQNGSVINSKLGADAVDGSKIADDSINSEHYVDASIDHAHLSNDCVDGDNIADDSINSEHYVDGSIDTAHIADDAVDANKLANSINSAIAANTAKDLTALSAANLTSGTIPDARFPATLPAISGANLTGIASAGQARNLLINGAMQVNVRGTNHQTAGSFNPVTGSIYTLDRWKITNSNSFDTDSAKVLHSSTAPSSEGFTKSLKVDIGNTETPSSGQASNIGTRIEGQDLQHLGYGTSSAKTMTLSFWVYSNKTGTYSVQVIQEGKHVLFDYTISSADTWEKKTITIVGNTADAIPNDNTVGLYLAWFLCANSDVMLSPSSTWTSGGSYRASTNQINLWDNGNNYWHLTGVQLEVGSTATDYAHEDYGTTLRKCQRYFFALCGPVRYETIGTGMIYYSGTGYANAFFPVSMRTQPSLVALSGSSGAYMYQTLLSNTAAYTHQIGIDSGKTTLQSASITCACPSSRAGEAFRLSAHFSHDSNNGQSFVNFDAEL